MSAPQPRVLFVNSGILGHRAVAGLLEDASRLMNVNARHINLSGSLSLADRIQRWVLSRRLAPRTGPAANLDLRRWREELNVGLLASRRIKAAERGGGRADVLHFHPQPTAYASLALMRRRPAIVSIDATQQLASEQTVSRLQRATYLPNIIHDGLVFRRAAAIVATSAWAARDLSVHYADCAAKVHVLPYPVRSFADTTLLEERYARASRHAPVRVLFMGGDFPRKGGFDLLDAWRAAGFGERAALDLVTDWPIDARDAPPGVRLVRGVTPNTSEWTDIWRGADFFVMPTRHEAFGMVYQEAAAAGIPTVATDVNAVGEIVRDGVTGTLVPVGDGPALVSAMRTLVDSADLRRRMGAAALSRIQETGTPERYARTLETIIQSVMEHDGTR